ncbi:MAG: hypothetical protein JRJ69_16960, partial [Deltaproteobacteria bacterium]|nr:hypothetical protein [Deltaproteobacteria bacterium]
IGNNTKAADTETPAHRFCHRKQRFYIGSVARPHLAAYGYFIKSLVSVIHGRKITTPTKSDKITRKYF